MAEQSNVFKTNKDGTLETLGQRYTRLLVAFNAKAAGTLALTAATVTTVVDAFSKYPYLQEAMTSVATHYNPTASIDTIMYHAGNYATVAESCGAFVLLVGACCAAKSAHTAFNKSSKAAKYVDWFGENYRPGDNARTDARLAAEAEAKAAGRQPA